MLIVDTHTHLYSEEFDDDRTDVVRRALDAGVRSMLLPNINAESIAPMLSMCQEWPGVFYPLMGLHPEDVRENYLDVLAQMQSMLYDGSGKNKQVVDGSVPSFVGIGEVGLDFYWDATYKSQQLDAFERQVQWAIEMRLPLVIHCRSAFEEMCEVLEPFRSSSFTGIFHCFSGTSEEADRLLSFDGFMLGIGGVATYKKSSLPDVLSQVPVNRIVVETDSPYLAPVPHRGKRNESAYIVDTVRKLSEIYDVTIEEMAAITAANAQKVFPQISIGKD